MNFRYMPILSENVLEKNMFILFADKTMQCVSFLLGKARRIANFCLDGNLFFSCIIFWVSSVFEGQFIRFFVCWISGLEMSNNPIPGPGSGSTSTGSADTMTSSGTTSSTATSTTTTGSTETTSTNATSTAVCSTDPKSTTSSSTNTDSELVNIFLSCYPEIQHQGLSKF